MLSYMKSSQKQKLLLKNKADGLYSMLKEMYFERSKLTSLSLVATAAKIHVIGVCGVAMAQIAVELSSMGFVVSGSDKEFYDPMGSLLKASNIDCKKGYQAENIPADCSLVVIGNSVTRDNTEVQATESRELPYTIFPQLLFDLSIAARKSIVVSGTHGKTTTSAMLAYVLEQLDQSPSYFFGGKGIQIPNGLKTSVGKISVVEGDEYDSAFFAKYAKFQFYKPDILIINAVEFDHADIYQNLEQILEQFQQMIDDMPAAGCIIGCFDDHGVRQLFSKIERKDLRLVAFGENVDASHKAPAVQIASLNTEFIKINGVTAVAFTDLNGKKQQLKLSIPGKFNLKNAVASFLAMQAAGLEQGPEWQQAFESFLGVARRQQVWLEEPIKLIEDFAHHPTAVTQTIEALREWNPNRRIIAVFEPRSVTSRRKIFENDYAKALSVADLIILKSVEARVLDKPEDIMQVSAVCAMIEQQYGKKAVSFLEVNEIEQAIRDLVKPGDLIVVMSNGSFGGLISNLQKSLAS